MRQLTIQEKQLVSHKGNLITYETFRTQVGYDKIRHLKICSKSDMFWSIRTDGGDMIYVLELVQPRGRGRVEYNTMFAFEGKK